jgi:hypothetical protein
VKKPDTLNDAFIPIWFKVPASFYRVLERVAVDAKMRAPDVLAESVKLFEKLHTIAKEAGMTRSEFLREGAKLIRDRKRSLHKPAGKPLVAYRWAKVPPEQRSEMARELARQRWAKRDQDHDRPT